MKLFRATLVFALVLASPGLAPYCAAAEVVAEIRGGISTPVLNPRGTGRIDALPALQLKDFSQASALPQIVEMEGAGVALPSMPAGAGTINAGAGALMNAAAGAPQAEAGVLAETQKAVAPSLQLIAEPKSSGEDSARSGEEVTTILLGGKASSFSSGVDASGPAARSAFRQMLSRAAARSGVKKPALYGAALMGLGAMTTGGVAAGLIVFPLMIASFILHEVAHARVAYLLGDPGPMLENRGSLKPRDWGTHFDWVWTLLVPVATYVAGHAIIGGAKPVEFDSSRFSKTIGPVWGSAIAGAAGPAMNLVLAGLGALAFAGLGALTVSGLWVPVVAALSYATGLFTVMNAAIAVFNLLPFYPLDGHFVFNAFLPKKVREGLREFYQNGGLLAWVPFAAFMGVVMKLGVAATVISWLAALLLGGPAAAGLHLAAAAVPAAAGFLIGRMRDSGVPKLTVRTAMLEHNFMKERLRAVGADLRAAKADPTKYDPEWVESLERQADGYETRMRELETLHPELLGR
jgi:Zn-dependent protease